MHSLLTTALYLSFIDLSTARLPLAPRELVETNEEGVAGFFNKLFTRSERRQTVDCYEDDYYNFVGNKTSGQAFCQAFVDYPSTTVTVDVTPRS